jgi:Tfp pilus assembly protein PilE
MKKTFKNFQGGFTIVELLAACIVFGIVAVSSLSTYVAIYSSSVVAKNKSIALQVATSELEKLKAKPYDELTIGQMSLTDSIINNVTYSKKIVVKYIDDAYDGCADYASDIEKYCRNYPPPADVTGKDKNPADYKLVNVKILSKTGTKLAEVDSTIGARVAESDSNTGQLTITVLDSTGAGVYDAKVEIVNNVLSPAFSMTDYTDSNGKLLVYNLKPDSSNYNVKISKTGYPTVTTIQKTGTLDPAYPNPNIAVQLEKTLGILLNPIEKYSLLIEARDEFGGVISGIKIATKGGYKLYNNDTQYSYSNNSPPSTDSIGLVAFDDLTPGPYIFCGDDKKTGCTVGFQNYELISAEAQVDPPSNPEDPITVPGKFIVDPPNPTFLYNLQNYVQKVILTLRPI